MDARPRGRRRRGERRAPRPCGRRGRGSRAAGRSAPAARRRPRADRVAEPWVEQDRPCRRASGPRRPAWPSQVNVVSRPIAIEASCRVSAPASVAVRPLSARSAPGRRHGYTPPVPAEQIATNLALINWTVLVRPRGRVVRGRPARRASRRRRRRGYLAFTAACAAAFGVLAYLSDTGLPPRSGRRSPVAGRTPRSTCRGGSRSCVFVVLAVVDDDRARARPAGAWSRRSLGERRRARASPARRADLGRRARWAPCRSRSSCGVLAAATGGVFAAMILGPLVPRDAAPARGAARARVAAAPVDRRAPGRAVRGLGRVRRRPGSGRDRGSGRSPRSSGRGRCSSGCG